MPSTKNSNKPTVPSDPTISPVSGVDLTEFRPTISQGLYTSSTLSKSGHYWEWNDEPGSERILMRHMSGSAVELQPNGNIFIKTTSSRLDDVEGNYNLVIKSDGSIHISGDLKLSVGGDFDLEVGGAFRVTAESKEEEITENSKEFVQGDKSTTVAGASGTLIKGLDTRMSLSGQYVGVKGLQQIAVEGNQTIASTGVLKMTNTGSIVITGGDNIRMGTNNISIVGATGTIGGAGVDLIGDTVHAEGGLQTKGSVKSNGDMKSPVFNETSPSISSPTNMATSSVMSEYIGGPQ